MITLSSGVAPHASVTASHTSSAYSGSVPVKLSGEYSSMIFPGNSAALFLTMSVPSTASCFISSLLMPNTTSLWRTDVELYICTIALGMPSIASKVLSMRFSLHCVRTCTVTSSGISFLSTSSLRKSNSIWLDAGKPISISLNPSFTSSSNISIFSDTTIGSTRAWFPSLRSTDTHVGAFSICLSGHFLSGYFMTGVLLYLL